MAVTELWNISAISSALGVTKATAWRLMTQKDAPKPLISGGRNHSWWTRGEVIAWANHHGREWSQPEDWQVRQDHLDDAIRWWRKIYLMDVKRRAKIRLDLIPAGKLDAALKRTENVEVVKDWVRESPHSRLIALHGAATEMFSVERGAVTRAYEIICDSPSTLTRKASLLVTSNQGVDPGE